MTREIEEANLATCLVKVLGYLEFRIVAASRVQESRKVNDWNMHSDRVRKFVELQCEVVRYRLNISVSLKYQPSPQCRY